MSGRRRLVFLNNQGLRSIGGGVGILRAVTTDLAQDHDVTLVSEDPPAGAGFREHALPRYQPAGDARWRINPWRKARHIRRALDPALIGEADLVVALDTHFTMALCATRPRRMLHLSLSCVTRQEWFANAGATRSWYASQYALLERLMVRRAAAIVVASPTHGRELSRFAGAREERIHVMPPVLGMRAPPLANRPRTTMVAVSRLTPVKNLAVLVPLLAALPEARLDVLGDGDDPAPLQALARDAGVGDRIEWLGGVSDPGPWLDGATLLLHPSRYESFGMAVHEAMRHGCVPVVFSPGRGRMSAAAELVAHGGTGLLADFDDVAGTATAIRALLRDPDRLAAMSDRARAAAAARDRFDYPAAFRALVQGLRVPAHGPIPA